MDIHLKAMGHGYAVLTAHTETGRAALLRWFPQHAHSYDVTATCGEATRFCESCLNKGLKVRYN